MILFKLRTEEIKLLLNELLDENTLLLIGKLTLLIFVVDEIRLLFKLFDQLEILVLLLLNPETTLLFKA